jgi:hypothetical protein
MTNEKPATKAKAKKVLGEPSATETNNKAKYTMWMDAMEHFEPYLEYKNNSNKTLNALYKEIKEAIGESGTLHAFQKSFERGPLHWAKAVVEMRSDGNSGNLFLYRW